MIKYLVSPQDVELIKGIKWFWGGRSKKYVHGCIKNRGFGSMHGLICPPRPKGYEIDHINGVQNDNRRKNLRFVTRTANMLYAYEKAKQTKLNPKLSFTTDRCNTTYVYAQYQLHGKKMMKKFSVKKMGLLEAHVAAVTYYDTHIQPKINEVLRNETKEIKWNRSF